MHARSPNPLGLKILPLTHCNQEINSKNPAKPKIPALSRSTRKGSQNPHPAAKNAARVGQPAGDLLPGTADSSCLASPARRNDKAYDSYFCGVYFRGYAGFGDWG